MEKDLCPSLPLFLNLSIKQIIETIALSMQKLYFGKSIENELGVKKTIETNNRRNQKFGQDNSK